MAQISNAANWKNWQPGMDTSKLLYIAGEVKGVILDDKDPQHPVCIKIDKIEPDQVTAQFITKKMKPVVIGWKAISYPNNDSVTVQWYMDFHLRWYPWEKFGSLVLEKSHGARMEQGLTNLKSCFNLPGNSLHLKAYLALLNTSQFLFMRVTPAFLCGIYYV
ncbi:MAG: hypothetical protein WDO71_14365 [Bacteroidota bacterium]